MPRVKPKQQVLLLLSLESTCHFLLRFSFSLCLSLSLSPSCSLLFSVLPSLSSLFFLLAEGKVGCFCFACTKAFETILLLIDEKTFKNIRRRRAACCCCYCRRRQLCFPVRTYACVVPLVLTLFFNPRERTRLTREFSASCFSRSSSSSSSCTHAHVVIQTLEKTNKHQRTTSKYTTTDDRNNLVSKYTYSRKQCQVEEIVR